MSKLNPLYPDDLSECLGARDAPPVHLRNQWNLAARAAVKPQPPDAHTDSVVDLPTLAPLLPPIDRRVPHNDVLRTTVDMLAARLGQRELIRGLMSLYPGSGDAHTDRTPPSISSPSDRRVQHNNALRTAVIMGDLLAKRLREKTAETVDFQTEGLIIAWQNAVERLRSFGK